MTNYYVPVHATGAHGEAVCCGTALCATQPFVSLSAQPKAQKRLPACEAASHAHTRRSDAARLPRSAESFSARKVPPRPAWEPEHDVEQGKP